jgi:hypothetical protein
MPPKRGRTKPAAGVARAAPAARPARGRRVKEEPPSEESSSEESSSDDSDDDPLDFFHLMPSKDDKGEAISIGFRNWSKRHWGKTSTSWSMARQNSASDGTLATWMLSNLRKGFCKGNVREIIAQCRNADNVPYSPEEIEDMVNDLNNNKHTLNLPFCFTKGAMELKNSILEHVFQGQIFKVDMGAAMDIEVGVYISRKGSAEAAWHYDNNHNFTFQLYGSKDWHTVDGGNNKNVISSRGLLDAPRNRTEQQSRTPDFSKERTTRLEAGSGIYIPPGHWHRVVPVDADPVCLSVDIRIASVTTARWMCENIFAEFMSDVTFGYCGNEGYPTNRFVGAGGQDETLEQDVISDLGTCQKRHEEKLKAILDGECFWKPPIAMPFEPHLSDGMELCGSLQFLIDTLYGDGVDGGGGRLDFAAELKTELGPKSRLAFNPFVAVTKKESDAGVVMHMRHTSGLTSMDYQHYGILCPSDCGCEVLIDAIIAQTLTAKDVKTLFDGYDAHDADADLVLLLMYINFLKLEESEEESETDEPDEPTPRGKSKATAKTSRKRQKYIVPNS